MPVLVLKWPFGFQRHSVVPRKPGCECRLPTTSRTPEGVKARSGLTDGTCRRNYCVSGMIASKRLKTRLVRAPNASESRAPSLDAEREVQPLDGCGAGIRANVRRASPGRRQSV